jgi:hypothetical protein
MQEAQAELEVQVAHLLLPQLPQLAACGLCSKPLMHGQRPSKSILVPAPEQLRQ